MQSFTKGMEAIGNNIANSNTVGFKRQDVHYADTFWRALSENAARGESDVQGSGIRIGNGVSVDASRKNFAQGAIEYTGISSDFAISGDGFFRLLDRSTGDQFLSRDGSFRTDSEGYLVNQSGLYLLGLTGGDAFSSPDTIGRVRVDLADSIKVDQNGDPIDYAGRRILADGSRTVAHPASSTGFYRTDDAGRLLDTSGTFAPGTEAVLLNPVSGQSLRAAYHDGDGSRYLINGAGNYVDNEGLELDGDPATDGVQAIAFDPSIAAPASATLWSPSEFTAATPGSAEALAAEWNPAAPPAGLEVAVPNPLDPNQVMLSLDSWSVAPDGALMVNLDDGSSYQRGQLLLQKVEAPDRLLESGANLFSSSDQAGPLGMADWTLGSTPNEGQLTHHLPNRSGNASVQARSLEKSNTNLTREFVSMIATQRSFQAGSRIITITDEMLKEAVNLKS